ncbi:MAG: bifunctional DNA primase/polymerase [Planktothrix sp.]|uniref:bifunctional DNA primase/polymerase n=1 Tax=Planktothrix sp. TaxID=3088171 RepID=UPI0038D45D4C
MNTTKTSTQNLIAAIETFPSEWELTPVFNKAPKIKNWQKGIDRNIIIKELEAGRANGIGLITGELSGCILTIDCDGPSAYQLVDEKSGGLPHTVSFTSGKTGRAQYLYLVPLEYQEILKNFTRKVLETGIKGEQLEIRYNASQSVLPPSQHPETDGYKWINDLTTPIAECPTWVIEQILADSDKPSNTDQLALNFNQNDEPIPLIQCLSVEHRNLIKSGLGYNCGRDDAAFKIVSDALGVETRLQYLGISFDGNARDLLEEFHSNCDKKEFTEKDINRIYRSAQKSNPTPCLSDDKLENCYKAWLKNQSKKSLGNNSKSIATTTTATIETESETEIKAEKSEITQEAYDYLYGDKNWICLNGVLHYFTGTYYKKSDDTEQRRRIANFLNHHPVSDNQGNIKYPYAKPNFVSQVLDWAKFLTGVSIDDCNPTGLNCLNGVLQIEWETTPPNLHPIPKAVLKPHSPDFYYLYEPVVTFDPNAKPDDCNRMLEVLEPEQQDIFLKTIGASLDIATVRRYKGRSIKALLCKGHGANGKDTLRESVAGLFGYHGITGATLDDFQQYDSGRKFPLAKLIHSRVNWASENGNAASLDKLQSLKAAITGDSLSCEHKGVNESEFNPQSIFLFNINDVPRMGAALEAIKSRFAVLSFDKTYKVGADPSKGEIEADSRYKYDPEWVKQNVLPAFLNRILEGLADLMVNGIDYSSTEKALDDIRCQNGHLWQFASDTGLAYNPDATLSAQELWEALEAWYLNNGTLTQEDDGKGKVKNVWEEPLNKSDKLIKTKNHVIAGFLKIFPKASRVVIDSKNGKTGIKGLCFQPAGNSPGNLRVTSGYPVGYPNPYTEGLPGKSGNFSESTGNKKNIDDIPANNDTLLGDTQPKQLEIVESFGESYPTYPETIQQGDFDTRDITRDIPATLPDKPVTLKELVEAEPAPPMTYLAVVIDFDSLQAGETLYDREGKPHTLKTNPWGYYWLTDTGLQIDKSNIGNFHRE